jgi:hypothetical protein
MFNNFLKSILGYNYTDLQKNMQPNNGKAKHVLITEWRGTHQILFCLVKMSLPLYKARDYISMGETNDLGNRCVWYTYPAFIEKLYVKEHKSTRI